MDRIARSAARGVRALALTLVSGAVVALSASVSARADAPSPALAEWIGTHMGEAKVPGLSVAVIRDGKVGWAAGFGLADVAEKRPVTPATLFQAASISKPVAAVAAMITASEGALPLDTDVDKIFAPDGEPTGGYFGHSGFNSGYLAVLIGSKTGGHGLVAMVNAAPLDMSGDVPGFAFLTDLVKRVADEEKWP